MSRSSPEPTAPATKLALFKTTIVIWSEYDPKAAGTEIEELARDATIGDSFCSKQETVLVPNARADADWSETEFFEDQEHCLDQTADEIAALTNSGGDVNAVITSDDQQRSVAFDARGWLARASLNDIQALAAGGWDAGEGSDPVGQVSQEWDAGVRAVFDYIEAHNRNRSDDEIIGFSVRVDGPQALAWLALARPQVHVALVADGLA